ncbi:MAG: ATPase domain-containing protein [Candidatus Micrarchaeaceae archaeon]|nr:hypothetical protein [Candidatus Micrarchaeota archaeon]HII09920.1 hypothetical protein [Candidatus Micrarchaeota archaeon]
MRKRVTTGNSELDKMLLGGIPEGNHVLIAGGPGTGKTLSCFEFLYRNALNGDNGIFISLEEKKGSIISNAKDAFLEFADMDKLLDEQKIIIEEYNLEGLIAKNKSGSENRYEFSNLMADIISSVQSRNAKRVVIDSVSILKLLLKDPLEYRALMISLLGTLRSINSTSMSTLEVQDYSSIQSDYPEFFLYDGLLVLNSPVGSNAVQSLQVAKMRGTAHSFQIVPYKITSGGIKLTGQV